MTPIKGICILIAAWFIADSPAAVRLGIDNVGEHKELFTGKRVGIVANHTSFNSGGKYIVDVLREMENVRVVALFSPEHGLQGTEEEGKKLDSQSDPKYGLPVYSLYGRVTKPTAEMLAGVDVLVFDIQDVGARFYTYLYTMSLAMEAAAENGKRFVVLDRPNPVNGLQVEGKVLNPQSSSLVGLYPIPVRYGMTIGELARMINSEGWLAGGIKADLTVVPMTGWRRRMWHDQTGLTFIKPSPNMPDVDTAALYPGLCLLEGTNISEARGTSMPFRQFGAPWIDAASLCTRLNELRLPGLRFETTSFTPTYSKFKDQLCHGVRIVITDRAALEPFWAGVQIVNVLFRMNSGRFEWHAAHFDHLCGTDTIREAIAAQSPLDSLKSRWNDECQAFQRNRQKFLAYPE